MKQFGSAVYRSRRVRVRPWPHKLRCPWPGPTLAAHAHLSTAGGPHQRHAARRASKWTIGFDAPSPRHLHTAPPPPLSRVHSRGQCPQHRVASLHTRARHTRLRLPWLPNRRLSRHSLQAPHESATQPAQWQHRLARRGRCPVTGVTPPSLPGAPGSECANSMSALAATAAARAALVNGRPEACPGHSSRRRCATFGLGAWSATSSARSFVANCAVSNLLPIGCGAVALPGRLGARGKPVAPFNRYGCVVGTLPAPPPGAGSRGGGERVATVAGARVGLGDCASVSRSRALMQVIVAEFTRATLARLFFERCFVVTPPPKKIDPPPLGAGVRGVPRPRCSRCATSEVFEVRHVRGVRGVPCPRCPRRCHVRGARGRATPEVSEVCRAQCVRAAPPPRSPRRAMSEVSRGEPCPRCSEASRVRSARGEPCPKCPRRAMSEVSEVCRAPEVPETWTRCPRRATPKVSELCRVRGARGVL